jgi:lipoprotein signal peptidase
MHAAYIAAPVLAALATLTVAANAGATIARLLARLGADPVGQALGGAATVGVLALLMTVALLGQHTPTRALSLIYLVAWLPLTIALSAAEAALASGVSFGALAQIGQTIATLLGGLALLPAVTLAVASRRADSQNLRGELAHYLGNAQKLVLLTATAGASVAFGIARGMPAEVAAFTAIVLEVSFLLALTRSREHRLHALALAAFGGVLAVVSVETLSVLSGLRALAALATIGEMAYLLTPAAGLAYIVASQLVGQPARIRIRPTQPTQADQVADQVDADQEPAYSLNGHGPK